MHRRHHIHYILLAIAVLLTVASRIWPLDLWISSSYFHGGEWSNTKGTIWDFLYDSGPLPALVVALASLTLFLWSFKSQRLLRWRKIHAYLAMVLLIGPGLIVNVMLKDNWGRPRPREVAGLGGQMPYEPVLTIDPASDGKSFPCGHCSMGFYFFAVFLLCRVLHPKAAPWALAGTLLYGTLIGWARVRQGGHFPTDVLWAGILVYAAALMLFRAMRLEDQPFYESKAPFTGEIPWKIFAVCLLLMLGVAGSAVVALPYQERRADEVPVLSLYNLVRPLDLTLQLEGALRVKMGDKINIVSDQYGFGLPGSKVTAQLVRLERGQTESWRYSQKKSGWFSELRLETQVQLAASLPATLQLRLEATASTHELDLRDREQEVNCVLFPVPAGTAQLNIILDPACRVKIAGEVDFEPKDGFERNEKDDWIRKGEGAAFNLRLKDAPASQSAEGKWKVRLH